MPVDEQSKTVFQMGEGDLTGKPDAGAHVERRVPGHNLFECEETTLRRAGWQPERVNCGRFGCGRNIVHFKFRNRWCYRRSGRS